jgi:hypothetical protein
MALLDSIKKTILGMGGQKGIFDTIPNPPGSFHDTYSIDGNPKTRIRSTNVRASVPQPSRLDERDASNNNKFKSLKNKYLDNPPK